VAARYRRHLFDDVSLRDLPDEPVFVFNASHLKTGKLFRFTKKYIADWTFGRANDPDVPLAVAVAASTAFPPFLSPVTLRLTGLGFLPEPGAAELDTRFAVLSDGGVYDNLGLETIWKRCGVLLVSDGGGALVPEGRPWSAWPLQTYRVLNLIDSQVRALRVRQLIGAFADGRRRGVYLGIRTDLKSYGVPPAAAVSRERALALAATRTRLARMPAALIGRLINWGYLVCDSGMPRPRPTSATARRRGCPTTSRSDRRSASIVAIYRRLTEPRMRIFVLGLALACGQQPDETCVNQFYETRTATGTASRKRASGDASHPRVRDDARRLRRPEQRGASWSRRAVQRNRRRLRRRHGRRRRGLRPLVRGRRWRRIRHGVDGGRELRGARGSVAVVGTATTRTARSILASPRRAMGSTTTAMGRWTSTRGTTVTSYEDSDGDGFGADSTDSGRLWRARRSLGRERRTATTRTARSIRAVSETCNGHRRRLRWRRGRPSDRHSLVRGRGPGRVRRSGTGSTGCDVPAGAVLVGGDCDDHDEKRAARRAPSAATGVDDDCDALLDARRSNADRRNHVWPDADGDHLRRRGSGGTTFGCPGAASGTQRLGLRRHLRGHSTRRGDDCDALDNGLDGIDGPTPSVGACPRRTTPTPTRMGSGRLDPSAEPDAERSATR
jgi:hypothetical protein